MSDVLEEASARFVDAVLTGDDRAALCAFADCRAEDLTAARLELLGWCGRAALALERVPTAAVEPRRWSP